MHSPEQTIASLKAELVANTTKNRELERQIESHLATIKSQTVSFQLIKLEIAEQTDLCKKKDEEKAELELDKSLLIEITTIQKKTIELMQADIALKIQEDKKLDAQVKKLENENEQLHATNQKQAKALVESRKQTIGVINLCKEDLDLSK